MPLGSAALGGDSACPADLNDDKLVNIDDLLTLLANWGTDGVGDLTNDDNVDVDDLLLLLSAWGDCPPLGDPIPAELAGNALTVYPFFDYAIAFNRGANVQLGLDPFRHPDLIDLTADVYVVADRSAAAWAADATLVDVRAGGAQTVAFAGLSVQNNIFTLDTGTLSGDAGIGIGVGYDIIIDVDRNGVLSGGDLIDGADGPGMYVVNDITTLGPLATTFVNYTGGTFLGQRTFYPTDIANMGQLPLIVISHGNGHQYTWYDYLQRHLASYGYVVMSHQNNTVPGIESASTTTLTNTNYLLANLATIAGGVLNGHVDGDTIIWIGHSRGGEGVVRAYDRLFDGTYIASMFQLSDIKLISSIAPTDFLGTASANPHAVKYHLIYGSSDGDVCGCPDNDIADSFNVFERAIGPRVSTYIHGADHNDFNCCGINDFQGPSGTVIGSAQTQKIATGIYLALVKYALEGNLAAKDYLWRQWEGFRPASVITTTTVVHDLRHAVGGPGNVVIDDYQTQTSTAISSSGGAVTFDVLNLTEGLCNDNNINFTWLTSDAMNGMVRGRTSDTGRNGVFNFNAPLVPAFIEYEIVPALTDWSSSGFLSLRAAQSTRHPDTIAITGDLTFTIKLRDGSGVTSAINIGAYSGGLEQPYARTGFGTGAGWQNEYEVIRVRLTDFLVNGSPLNLSDIVALRLEFGGLGATAQGRIAIDDIMLTND